jgi:thioester reductase-like protein
MLGVVNQLGEDSRIADALSPPAGTPGSPREILLTGVTGFLGGEIASELLRATDARLHCVVRDRQGVPARERLEEVRRRLGANASRLVLVDGDATEATLSDPGLAERVDTIVHCAALVNLFAPYAALRGTNVLSARAVLDFASRGNPKAVHFVSTAGIFLSPRYRSRTVLESEIVHGEGLRNGYSQSKWAADTMMLRARERGFAVNLYRPAFVGWHSESGRHGEHDLVALLLASSLLAGQAPRLDLQINSTPVDYVAGTVVKLLSNPAARGGTFHVASRRAVPFVELAAMAALPLVPLPEWQAAVAARAAIFAKFAAMVGGAQADEESGSLELGLEHDRTYDDARVRELLGEKFRPAPPLDAAQVSRFVHALRRSAAARN